MFKRDEPIVRKVVHGGEEEFKTFSIGSLVETGRKAITGILNVTNSAATGSTYANAANILNTSGSIS